MTKPVLFFRLTKVDEAKREVWGRATQEVVDRSGEIFDYATSVPYFRAWSEGFAKDTDGKSLGNVRAMHGKVVAGKVISIDFNDSEKAIDIGTKIVNDNEWKMVEEGCYTGFSVGGAYVGKKWTDKETGAKRFTANPVEISIVDSPCVQTAKFFDVVKADGVVEQREFRSLIKSRAEVVASLEKWAGEEIGDTMTALDALQSIFRLYLREASEPDEPADQVPALAAVIANLKAFIASEIKEDNSEKSQAVMALAASVAGLEKISAKVQGAPQEIVSGGGKSGQVPPSAADNAKEAVMTAEQLAKAAMALEDVHKCLKGAMEDHKEAVAKAVDAHEELHGKIKKAMRGVKAAMGEDKDEPDPADDGKEKVSNEKAAAVEMQKRADDLAKANEELATLRKRVAELEKKPLASPAEIAAQAQSVSKAADSTPTPHVEAAPDLAKCTDPLEASRIINRMGVPYRS